jgi:hypothetical protein
VIAEHEGFTIRRHLRRDRGLGGASCVSSRVSRLGSPP